MDNFNEKPAKTWAFYILAAFILAWLFYFMFGVVVRLMGLLFVFGKKWWWGLLGGIVILLIIKKILLPSRKDK